MKKISVIVPVYNVKKYLRKCVDSIKNQTYQNIEIILVDDGSTDGSENLCDEIARTDNRIVIIHKENGGLSDARNVGMDVSSGDYIGFVDSDDYIDEDFFEILVTNLEKYNADVSCCRYTNVWEDGKTEQIGNDGKLRIYEGDEALKEYLYGKTMDPFSVNKLYRAKLLGNSKYPDNRFRFIKGILSEDNPFCIELFKQTNKVVLVGKSKYNYLQAREGAITSSKISQKRIDAVHYWDKVRMDCHKHYPELEEYALRRQVLFYIGLYNKIYNDKSYEAEAHGIRAFVKEHNIEIQQSDICEKTVKISVGILSKSARMYSLFMRGYKKIVGRARL